MKESINSILTYTSITLNDILNMTYPQFTNTIDGVARKLNWEMKVSIVSSCPESSKEVDLMEDYPLFAQKKVETNKVMTMSDALAFKEFLS